MAKVTCNLLVRWAQPTLFRKRVALQLQIQGKDETNPEEVQIIMLFIVQKIDPEEENAREELDPRLASRFKGAIKILHDKPNKPKSTWHNGRRERPASKAFKEQCFKSEGFAWASNVRVSMCCEGT